jgi:AraC family transcriptional regulator
VARRLDREWTDVQHWPGMRSEYSWLPAGDGATRTKPDQVGVSFSSHRSAVYQVGARIIEADIAEGAVFVTGSEPIVWHRIREFTDAIEVYPDRTLLGGVELEPAIATRDGTVLAIASLLRRAHLGDATLSDIAASTLAHRLTTHLLGDVRSQAPGRLDRATVDRVAELVDSGLGERITLDRLAAEVRLSPFHFARAFKATTGLAPHQFVVSRRMDRALRLLSSTPSSVLDVAHAVGLSNVSHFRRVFRAHFGVLPGEVRKIRPSGRRRGL